MTVSTKTPNVCSAQTKTVDTTKVCSGRGKSYCLIHRRYFETSWCPDCGRSKGLFDTKEE
ncbi:hypothetical protein CLU79DRAFT_836253 [Phycomyces nitens]|nr:hypothetical protein CLU79DRAFT_836253 [Phycomyces nitens]